MPVTSKTTATAKGKDDEPTVDPAAEQPVQPEAPARVESDCVVDSPFHVGRAVNGKVCSYHALHYKADGTPR